MCTVVVAASGLGRLDETLGLFDYRADRNAGLTYLDREYGDRGWAPDRRVIEDARLWMPEDARYRIVPRGKVETISTGLSRRTFCATSAPAPGHGLELGPVGLLLRVRPHRARRLRSPVRGTGRDQVRSDAPMTPRAIAGLFVLHVFFLAVGAGLLWGLRGWRTWPDL